MQYIVQNSWGKNYGIKKGYDIVHTDLECDIGIISSGDALIPVYKSSASTITNEGTFGAFSGVNTTSTETDTESDDTPEKSICKQTYNNLITIRHLLSRDDVNAMIE